MQLNTKQMYVPQQTPPTPPSLQFTFPKPLSYEFRVAEYVDDEGKILKVGLQVQVWEHDEFGSGNVVHPWSDVPRARFNKDGAILP